MIQPLYNETRRAANIMVTSPIVLNTQDKRRAFAELGKQTEKAQQTQNAEAGTLMAQTKFRIWNANPIGTDDGKTPVTVEPKTYAAYKILSCLALILAAVVVVKAGKKILKKKIRRK